jgi:hypothetical protein
MTRFAARGLRAVPLVAAVVVLSIEGACEFFVDGELGTVLCADEGSEGPPACAPGWACIEGVCTEGLTPEPKLGHPCQQDAECAKDDFCWKPSEYGESGAPVCSRPCCSSSECGEPEDGIVCWAPSIGGGSFCRDAGALLRGRIGPANVGEACLDGTFCRSGMCDAEACVDVCCSDANCTVAEAASSCRLASAIVSTGPSWTCVPSVDGLKVFLEACASDGDCASGMCLPIGDKLRCSQPCCSSDVCGKLTIETTTHLLGCANVERGGSLVNACARVLPADATQPVGAECLDDIECRGGDCIAAGSKKICSDVCCTDASCGDPHFVCRPRLEGPTWVLRCALK